MGQPRRVKDLDISQDLDHERRAWTVQRAGWAVMFLLVLAALAGLFGSGPASWAKAGEASGLELEYERFARFTGPTTLTFHVAGGSAGGTTARLWLDDRYVEAMEVESVTPEPERVVAGNGRLLFEFALAEPAAPLTATFHLQPRRIGRMDGRAGLDPGRAVTFGQLVYP